ncbi:unnamed protein product [Prunus armeniaca]|uniref:Uncharacterized protein n=1 Tax=Prunus armeniaca TaxID=36596 RepID=A0A6J5TFI3_PRUAR|nr:unnamed protein product [Prunus armeniaca]
MCVGVHWFKLWTTLQALCNQQSTSTLGGRGLQVLTPATTPLVNTRKRFARYGFAGNIRLKPVGPGSGNAARRSGRPKTTGRPARAVYAINCCATQAGKGGKPEKGQQRPPRLVAESSEPRAGAMRGAVFPSTEEVQGELKAAFRAVRERGGVVYPHPGQGGTAPNWARGIRAQPPAGDGEKRKTGTHGRRPRHRQKPAKPVPTPPASRPLPPLAHPSGCADGALTAQHSHQSTFCGIFSYSPKTPDIDSLHNHWNQTLKEGAMGFFGGVTLPSGVHGTQQRSGPMASGCLLRLPEMVRFLEKNVCGMICATKQIVQDMPGRFSGGASYGALTS